MVQRYDWDAWDDCGSIAGGMFKEEDGGWVSHDDYAALEAQVRHLEVYPGRCERLDIENAALRYRLSKLEREK